MAEITQNLPKRLRDIDRSLLAVVVILYLCGLVLIFSADHAQGSSVHFSKQIIFGIVGLILMSLLASLPYRVYYALAYVIYAAALLGLLLVDIAGFVGYGARRWLSVGGITLQPSEPAKIAFILALARMLADHQQPVKWWGVIGAAALLALPLTVLVLAQPDLGTATLFPVVGAAMLAWFGLPPKFFILLGLPLISLLLIVIPWLIIPLVLFGLFYLWRGGARWWTIAALALLCCVATFSAPRVWNHLEPYQQRRLTTFLDPASDPLGAGYQIIQSKVAIGSGGVVGRGYLKGTQTQLRFLPQQHTDFIFALAGEEFGFVGTSTIIVLFMLLIWRSFNLAALCKSQFFGLVAAGLATMILYHAIVNIGMVTGLLPVTGLPLPFLSYGGTFLLTCMAAAGMILSLAIHRRER